MQPALRRSGWPAALALALVCGEAATEALRPRGVPAASAVAVEEHFTAAEVARARRFGRPQLVLAGLGAVVQAGLLGWLVRRPPRLPDRVGDRPLAGAALTGACLSVILAAATLPVSALMRRRALAVGLITQSWRGWALDVLKATAIGAPLAAAGAALALALMRRHGECWWIWGSVAGSAVVCGLTFAGPVVLDPLFNRFTPLADADVREDLLALAEAAGVRVGQVLQVDASRRTTAANAYVNGLGATRRVVLFDTLLDQFTRAETRLVVAHELAHVRHRDVPRSLLHLALTAPAALRAVDRLARHLDGMASAARSIPRTSPPPTAAPPPSVAALALALGLIGAALVASGNRLSRAVERRADTFALELADAPEAFTSFERRIVVANLADPDPPRWVTALLASHPPVVERIGIARAYAERRAAAR
ncbi:MAG: endopeptidase [Solirubrobacteraceae bacterium]|nr:endopeptidase [Solirubrobacteraceae bacterium]